MVDKTKPAFTPETLLLCCRRHFFLHTATRPLRPAQDGDSSKTSESTSTEEKSSESPASPDSSNHLVALDIKWFVSLHHTLLRARDALVFTSDMIEKNMEKLLRPKGTNTQGGGMYSF